MVVNSKSKDIIVKVLFKNSFAISEFDEDIFLIDSNRSNNIRKLTQPPSIKYDIEWCDIDNFLVTRRLIDSIERQTGTIYYGEDTSKFFDEVLIRLLYSCTYITVVDQYIFFDHRTSLNYGRKSGLDNFLDFLDSLQLDAKREHFSVDVYAAYNTTDKQRPLDRDYCLKVAKDAVQGKQNLRSFRLFLAENKDFRRKQHDRFIKFGCRKLGLGNGLGVFEGNKVKNNTNYGLDQWGYKDKRALYSLISTCSHHVVV